MNYKEELCRHAHICEAKGLVNAIEGNISIFDRQNNLLYITPSRTRKLDLKEQDVAVLDFTTEEQLCGKPASSEYRLHKAALLARTDCNAVVHSHAPHLTSYALSERPIRCDTIALFQFVHGEIKCLPYGKPGTVHIADGIEDAISDRPICLLGHHGAVAVGETLERAMGWLEAFENAAKTIALARAIPLE